MLYFLYSPSVLLYIFCICFDEFLMLSPCLFGYYIPSRWNLQSCLLVLVYVYFSPCSMSVFFHKSAIDDQFYSNSSVIPSNEKQFRFNTYLISDMPVLNVINFVLICWSSAFYIVWVFF